MGLTLNQEIFIGITFIVIIIIIILVKDKIMAILIVGLIANFLAISSQLNIINDRHLQNQSNQNGFKNKKSILSNIIGPSKLISCNKFTNITPDEPKINEHSETNNGYDLYEGKINEYYDQCQFHEVQVPFTNKFSNIIDKNNIGYDADAKYVREQIIRNDNDRINPVCNTRNLINKYIIPEINEDTNKPWWE